MTQRPTEAIEAPHGQRVARSELIEEAVELWPLGQLARGRVDEHPVTTGRVEIVDLQRRVLLSVEMRA
jgi:hypothetical protein